jgi:hypothetical protein
MKFAMMKSFQESGGTCLSTNWVKLEGKVGVTPPEGMVAKKIRRLCTLYYGKDRLHGIEQPASMTVDVFSMCL